MKEKEVARKVEEGGGKGYVEGNGAWNVEKGIWRKVEKEICKVVEGNGTWKVEKGIWRKVEEKGTWRKVEEKGI
ncbi:hypothetical protein Pmani_031400 [Petrolisthes manimaculis]|uniref:Uncharacterized protein n=1 Tax=Petrolisthes manimaculis TaxID=1843537 RepID=A0AAE1NTW6_9EUCA|nr:hypothetical protein Pmani_031400 [Petrolisthes manimaculis]